MRFIFPKPRLYLLLPFTNLPFYKGLLSSIISTPACSFIFNIFIRHVPENLSGDCSVTVHSTPCYSNDENYTLDCEPRISFTTETLVGNKGFEPLVSSVRGRREQPDFSSSRWSRRLDSNQRNSCFQNRRDKPDSPTSRLKNFNIAPYLCQAVALSAAAASDLLRQVNSLTVCRPY